MRALVLLAVVGIASTLAEATWVPAEIAVARRDWEMYCQPGRPAPGTYGAIRMVYSHPTCEFEEY